MRLFLKGGSDLQKGETKIINKIVKTVKNPSLLILQWTSKNRKKNLKYRKILTKYFKSIGVKKVLFTDFKESREKIIQKIVKSNLIYLPGGDPILLYKTIKKKKLVGKLKNFKGTIFGGSAGALIQCEKYIIIKSQDNYKRTKLEQGIGLIDIIVSVHYGSERKESAGENAEEELKNISKKLKIKIYAIAEKSAIEYYNRKIKFHGKIFYFNNGKKKRVN